MARSTPASERVRRIVALLGSLTPGTRVPIAALAARLAADPAELAADLETLALCGVAPYDPGDLVPVLIEDGMVEVWGEMPAAGPVRLSAGEARALAAALRAAGVDAESGLLARLLAAAAPSAFDPAELERTVRAATAAHGGDVYETLAGALEDHAVVTIEYARAGADAPEPRDVEPLSMFAERGAWYLTAWCRRAGDWRTFRLDRIRSASASAERFDPVARERLDSATSFDPAGLPRALVRFTPGESFSDRDWPGATVVSAEPSGEVVASIPYAGTGWIARHVAARLGGAEVLEPAEVRSAVRELASR